MKSLHLLLSATLMFLATLAFAQSESTKSFDKLKTLAGTWEGRTTSDEPAFQRQFRASFPSCDFEWKRTHA